MAYVRQPDLVIEYLDESEEQYKKVIRRGDEVFATKLVAKKTADPILDTVFTIPERFLGVTLRKAIAEDAEYFQFLMMMVPKGRDEMLDIVRKVVPEAIVF